MGTDCADAAWGRFGDFVKKWIGICRHDTSLGNCESPTLSFLWSLPIFNVCEPDWFCICIRVFIDCIFIPSCLLSGPCWFYATLHSGCWPCMKLGSRWSLFSVHFRVFLPSNPHFADVLNLPSPGKVPFYTPTSTLIQMHPLYKPQPVNQHASKPIPSKIWMTSINLLFPWLYHYLLET